MTKTWIAAAVAGLLLAGATPLFAQTSALPPTIASAGVTQQQWTTILREVRTQAQRAGVAEAALRAAAESAGANFARSGHFDTFTLQQTIFRQVADQADQIADLQRTLDALSGESDPAISSLYAQAHVALNDGRLSDADRLLAQAAERDLATIVQADAEAKKRRLRASETIEGRGTLALAQASFPLAAEFYAKAAATVPASALSLRALYYTEQSHALALHGRLFSAPQSLRSAIQLTQNDVLPLYNAQSDTPGILSARLNLGSFQAQLGELGDHNATQAAIRTLESVPRPTDPSSSNAITLWAAAQNNLGNALRADDKLLDAEQAYRRAVSGPDIKLPEILWATVVDNLASVMGEIAQARKAPAPAEAFTFFRGALTSRTVECCPLDRATTLVNLAGIESLNGELTGDAALLNAARNHSAEAISLLSALRGSVFWIKAQINIGLTEDALGSLGDAGAYRRAVDAYRLALSAMDRKAKPLEWARIQSLLGESLRKLRDRQSIDESVQAQQLALEVYDRGRNRPQWASSKYELGMALLSRSEDGGTNSSSAAIAALEDALGAYSATLEPLDWAQTNQNLGVAYERIGVQTNDLSKLQLAEAAYRRSLTVYTREKTPPKWALAQTGVGNILRSVGERTDDVALLRKAVGAYQSSLTAYTKEADPKDWAEAWNNLGSAYAAIGDRKSLDLAVAAYQHALEVRTHAAMPDEWSSTQLNLGSTHLRRFNEGEQTAITAAIESFRHALTTRSRSRDPESWARAQYSLALALGTYAESIERRTLPEAITAAERAVEGFRETGSAANLGEAAGLLNDLRRLSQAR